MPNSDSKLNTEGWGEINWHQVERYVFKLQTRIYAASRQGEVKKVRKLQRTLMRSWSNKIKNCLLSKAKYVLDADIAQCFDRINHQELLTRLGIHGKVRRQIAAWLKSGVIDQGVFTAISEGTPQGGVISPLLANIALHGLEHQILKEFPRMAHRHRETWFHKKGSDFNPPNIIRYADKRQQKLGILNRNRCELFTVTVTSRCVLQ